MGTDLAMSLVAMRMAANSQAAGIAIMRVEKQMQESLVQMLDDAVRAAAPAGQGKAVDKTA